MTTVERLAAEETLRGYIRGLDHAALLRVADEPLCRWNAVWTIGPKGRRCLVGVAEDLRRPEDVTDDLLLSLEAVTMAFDDLCAAEGLERAVASVKLLASVLLHDRETAVVRALVGAGREGTRCP